MEDVETEEDPPSSLEKHSRQARLIESNRMHNNFFETKSQSASGEGNMLNVANKPGSNKLDSIQILVNQNKNQLMLNQFSQNNRVMRRRRGMNQFSSYAESVADSFQSNTKGHSHTQSQSLSATHHPQ